MLGKWIGGPAPVNPVGLVPALGVRGFAYILKAENVKSCCLENTFKMGKWARIHEEINITVKCCPDFVTLGKSIMTYK